MTGNIKIHFKNGVDIPSLLDNMPREYIHEMKEYLRSQMEIFFGQKDLKYFSLTNFIKSIEQIKNLIGKKEFISFLNERVMNILFTLNTSFSFYKISFLFI